MNKTIYLVCGVSGSGKTWVCSQLKDKFTYVPHDAFFYSINHALVKASRASDKPLITEVPFGERPLRESLERIGFKVVPIFVIERPDVVAARYMMREKKPIQKSAYSRAATISSRATEWKAKAGTSADILQYLQDLKL